MRPVADGMVPVNGCLALRARRESYIVIGELELPPEPADMSQDTMFVGSVVLLGEIRPMADTGGSSLSTLLRTRWRLEGGVWRAA